MVSNWEQNIHTYIYIYIPKISKFYVEKGYLVYVRGHQQITFSMLNRFYQLSKTLPPPPVLIADIIVLDRIPSKINWKYTAFSHRIPNFKGTSHKLFYNTVTSSFSFYCFTSVFIPADAIFYNFLELHSTLSETIFFHECSFLLTDSLNTSSPCTPIPQPHPFNGQNLLSTNINFSCLCSHNRPEIVIFDI